MKKSILLWCCIIVTQLLVAQTLKVSGVVKGSEDGLPLPGVSVVIKGGKLTGTITDIEGKFSINVPAGRSLSFTYIGYRTLVKVINQSQDLNISLESDSRMLDEVVAIGYGTMKKSDLTGSVGSVSGKELKMAPVARVDEALQGRIAGVTVNANSGQPGADAIIHVRGVGTVGISTPIYVVDGIVTDNINFLSTSDIASLEVLKDASTAAIYGSRGANGVILITTKKGDKTGKTNINFESYVGTQNTWKKLDVMGRDQFANLVALMGNTKTGDDGLDALGLNEWIRSNYTPNSSTRYPLIVQKNADGSIKTPGIDYTKYDTNWQDQVFVKNAMMHNYYVSADGGTEKSNYLMSFNKFDQDGTLIGSYYNRMTIRLNTSMEVKKWLRIGEDLSFTNSHSYNVQNNGNTALIASALSMAPWDPVTYAAGTLSGYPGKQVAQQVDLSGRYSTPSLFRNVMHPFNQVYNSKPNNGSIDWVGDIFVELRPFKGLVVKGDVNSKIWNGSSRTYNPILDVIYNASAINSVSASETQSQVLTYEGTATYNAKIGKSEITAMAGTSMEETNSYTVNASGNNLQNTDPSNWYVSQTQNAVLIDATGGATPTRSGGDGVSFGRMASYFGRLNYIFDNKYLLTGNFRYDGSSKLTPGHYWRAFPSIAGAWKISEEKFFEPVKKIVDFMKLRVGWGLLGNERILGENSAIPAAMTGTYFVGYPYGTPSTLANGAGLSLRNFPQVLNWENTNQTDIGLDFGLFGKISGNIDVYRRITDGMLMVVQAAAQVGFMSPVTANAGTVKNDGVEFTLDYHDKIGALNYSIGGNISLTNNEMTATNGGQPIWNGFILSDQGLPLNTIYVNKYLGVFQTQAEIDAYTWTNPVTGVKKRIQDDAKPGDAKYADLNHDGQISTLDRYNAGNSVPPLTYGFNVTANFKGFDLQVFFQGVTGNQIYNALRQNKLEVDGSAGVLSADMKNVFFPVLTDPNDPTSPWINGAPGSNGTIPNPTKTAGNATNNALASTRFVEDGSYLRLKNLQFGYTIPENLTRKVGINKVRFYVGGSNLLTFTKYKGFDPEVGNNGVDYGNFPQARTVLVGLNMNF